VPKKKIAEYTPTSREQEIAAKHLERSKELTPSLKHDKVGKYEVDHKDQSVGVVLLMDSCGTVDVNFLNPLLTQLANATGKEMQEANLNFALSVIADIKPKDQLEAMLAAQMACVHIASMTFARRLAHTETIAQQDSAEKAYNKLLRTFTTQMEALRKYRTGGEQKVTVHHVQVNEGGQAIVGNVNQGGGAATKN
jgi:hypothetical protein